MRVLGAFLLFAGATMATAQTDPRTAPSRYVSFFYGNSVRAFGSEDWREGGGIAYAIGKPERRFRLGAIPAQLIFEGRITRTRSDGVNGRGAGSAYALGVSGIARHRWPLSRRGVGFFTDLGLGVEVADKATHDLRSRANFTETVGVGIAFPAGGDEAWVALRLMHISNANLYGRDQGDNRGQNLLFLMVGYRF